MGPPPRPPLVAYIPHRKGVDEIRQENDNFERPQAPPGRPYKSSDEKKDELALRNQFYGKTPQEMLKEQPPPPRAPPPRTSLREQIEDEVAERQDFIDQMRQLGRCDQELDHRITCEINERLQDLKKLERLESDD